MANFLPSLGGGLHQDSIQKSLGKTFCFSVVGIVGSLSMRKVAELTFTKSLLFGGLINGAIFSLFDFVIRQKSQNPYIRGGGPILCMEVLRWTPLLGRVSTLSTAFYIGGYISSLICEVVFNLNIFQQSTSSHLEQLSEVEDLNIDSLNLDQVSLSHSETRRIKQAVETVSSLVIKKLRASNESYVFSASSLFCIILMMLAAFSQKKDQQKMIDKCGLQGISLEKIYKGFAEILRQANQSKKPTIKFASAIVAHKRVLSSKFRALMQYIFNAEYLPHNMDKINDFVNKATRKMIPKIMDQNPQGNMLINAACFDGTWIDKFKPCGFKPFHGLQGNFSARFMEKEATMGYYYMDSKDQGIPPFTVIEQKYETDNSSGQAASFVMIVPDNKCDIHRLEKHLENKQMLGEYFDNIQRSRRKVHLTMPKIDDKTKIKELKPILQETFGFKNGFPLLAEFDGNGVDDIIQDCCIECDEKGTKAAAVTQLRMRGGGGTIHVRVDRPFLYFIRGEGMTLFEGGIKTKKGLLAANS